MKVCQYCGTENADDAVNCVSCGANAFRNKCANCGTEFDGAFCPSCGVRAGETGRTCPRCGSRYYTNACPTCGFVPGQDRNSPVQQAPGYPKQRSVGKTILWIAGWLLFFPIPLTIIIARSRMQKWLKAVLIALLWLVVIFGLGRSEDGAATSSGGTAWKTAFVVGDVVLPGPDPGLFL